MVSRLRALVAALVICAVFLVSATPAPASSLSSNDSIEARSVNVLFDALFLRPVGLVVTVVGTVFYTVAVVPVVAITRPTDLGKPLTPLVIRPARYTFIDPLGAH